MTETARLRELLAEATPGHRVATAFAFVTREQAVFLDAARAALPALLDRLEAAEAVVEAAREVPGAGPMIGLRIVQMNDALRRYDEVRR